MEFVLLADVVLLDIQMHICFHVYKSTTKTVDISKIMKTEPWHFYQGEW